MRIEASGGGDPTKEVVETIDENKKRFTRDVAHFWFARSQDWLAEAAEQRAGGGPGSPDDSEGRVGRQKTGLMNIHNSAQPPVWVPEDEQWEFSYPHRGAVYQEFGAEPHTIRAKKAEVLAFEWPDAPKEVKEQFEHTEGDLVFFDEIEHPGIPAIGFVRNSRDQTVSALERKGHEIRLVEPEGDAP